MTRYAAFLRGVNLGKRSVKSADLKAAFEQMGFTNVKTLLASGNVLFDAASAKGLRQTIEAGLKAQFGFEVGTVLRTLDALRKMVASDPFGGVTESEAAKLHVSLFADPIPAGIKPSDVAGDYDVPTVTDREIFLIVNRKPAGTYLGNCSLGDERALPKGTLVTLRNWNTILKAVA
jgi:uncharacterized protein (DUF1697 family)